jgi:hypothetical protein
LKSKILEQQQVYLPQIPLDSLDVLSINYSGQTVLVIKMQFTVKQQTANSVIAIDTSQTNKILDFEVSWQ